MPEQEDGQSPDRTKVESEPEEEYEVKDGRTAQERYPAIVTGKQLGTIPDRR